MTLKIVNWWKSLSGVERFSVVIFFPLAFPIFFLIIFIAGLGGAITALLDLVVP